MQSMSLAVAAIRGASGTSTAKSEEAGEVAPLAAKLRVDCLGLGVAGNFV